VSETRSRCWKPLPVVAVLLLAGWAAEARAQSCEVGTTTTQWATSCPTAPPATCVAGTWQLPGSTTGDPVQCQSTHFVVYSPNGTITAAQCQAAINQLENVIWPTYFGAPIFFTEPYCNSSTKFKAGIHIRNEFALTGGGYGQGRIGMWVGPGATNDHWGLAHEFAHSTQSSTRGLSCGGSNTCGWIYESHANFMPHQLPEFANNVHCSEMLANMPHLYLGSTRDRYCNWQFMEYLKDKHCYSAVNQIWTTSSPSADPFVNIRNSRGWSQSQLNDFFAEWAMHNITWDYRVSSTPFRNTYGPITDESRPERRLRLTQLEPLDSQWASNRRFFSPYLWAPQRWGYNVVRLFPVAGATSVTVTFRGVEQAGANSDWRWGLVATSSSLTNPRYSSLQRGANGELTFCVNAGENLFLVVMGTPSVHQPIVWDQAYSTIFRYPWRVQLQNAWPEGFQNGQLAACPSGLVRHANGGGCAPSGTPASVFVGPFAKIVGGSVSGSARIEDHATVVSGTVSGGRVGGLSLIRGFNVSPSATAQTTFYPLGFFEGNQGLTGTATLYGDVEYRGAGLTRSSGQCSGFVSSTTCIPGTINEVNTARPPYTWPGDGPGVGVVPNGTYRVIARHSAKALNAVGTGDGADVNQTTYTGGTNQRWTLTHLGGNVYQIIGVASGRALQVASTSTANGVNVDIRAYSGAANQRWTISATSGGYFRLTPVSSSGSALDVNGVSTADGANVHQWNFNGGNNQQWIFQAP
jgi:hypothetical protein